MAETTPSIFRSLREFVVTRPLRLLGGLMYAATLVIAVLLVVSFALTLYRPSIRETYGRIYVESPEVYTRQRLVDDRYQQDAWLRRQFESLDEADHWIEGYRSESTTASLGLNLDELVSLLHGRPENDTTSNGPSPSDDRQSMVDDARAQSGERQLQGTVPFQTEFALRSATRDKLRQLILENALDDRHDLTGNTVFGLKFDTVVVPGSHTSRSPAVIVEMPPPPFAAKTPADLLTFSTTPPIESDSTASVVSNYYQEWLNNVEKRLNHYISYSCDERGVLKISDLPRVLEYALYLSPTEAQDVSRSLQPNLSALVKNQLKTLKDTNLVASIQNPVSVELQLPPQWSNIASVAASVNWVQDQKKEEPEARDIGEFVVRTRRMNLFITNVSFDQGSFSGDIFDERDRPIRVNASLSQYGRCNISGTEGASLDCNLKTDSEANIFFYLTQQDGSMFGTRITASDFAALVRSEPSVKFEFKPASGDPIPVEGWNPTVDVGLYTFLDQARTVESYSYAAFPRGDVEGVVVDAYKGADLASQGPVDVEFSARVRSGGVRAEPRLLNFSGGGRQDLAPDGSRKGFDFGWAVVRPDLQTPVLTSQMVLVSVPAYLNLLELTVTTGWIDTDYSLPDTEDWTDLSLKDRLARLIRQSDRMTMNVQLPPDYDALDNMMLPGTSRLGPAINEVALCDQDLHIAAGQTVNIVIPGERLWRSTVVTLGGQQASGIRVLPDMRGIIATFEEVAQPIAPPDLVAALGQPAEGEGGRDIVAGGEGAETPGDEAESGAGWMATAGEVDQAPADATAVTVPLAVWTSQGVDWLLDYVHVHPPASDQSVRGKQDAVAADQHNATSGGGAAGAGTE